MDKPVTMKVDKIAARRLQLTQIRSMSGLRHVHETMRIQNQEAQSRGGRLHALHVVSELHV
jgi:hypothetical protein